MTVSVLSLRPLPLWVLAYTTGLTLGIFLQIGIGHSYVCLALSVVVLLVAMQKQKAIGIALLVLSASVGIWNHALETKKIDIQTQQVEQFLHQVSFHPRSKEELAPILCAGRVLESISTEGQTDFVLQINFLRMDPVEEKQETWAPVLPSVIAHVKVMGPMLEPLFPGDFVWISASFRKKQQERNPIHLHGSPEPALSQESLFATVAPTDLVRFLEPHQESGFEAIQNTIKKYILQSRQKLLSILKTELHRHFPEDPTSYAVLSSLILGDRQALKEAEMFRKKQNKPSLDVSFRDAGIYHILSVSGFHLAIIGYFIYLAFVKLIPYLPYLSQGFPFKKVAAVFSLGVIVVYTFLTGAQIATVRSAWMVSFGFLAILCKRRSKLAEALSFAAICMLGPFGSFEALLDPSFQLSMGSLLSIAYLRPLSVLQKFLSRHFEFFRRIQQWQKQSPSADWFIPKMIGSLDVSLSAMLVTAPLCAFYFFQYQGAAPIGNLLALPIGELLVLPVGFLGLCISCVSSPVGSFILMVAGYFVKIMVFVTDKITSLSLSFNVPPPSEFELFLWMLACVLFSLRFRKAALLWVFLLCFYLAIWFFPKKEMTITFLDVGQGDAAIIETPRKKVIVIDAGGSLFAQSFDPGDKILGPFLRSRGYQAIDLLIASHPHADHIGGMGSLFEQFPIHEFWTAEPTMASNNFVLDHKNLVWNQVLDSAQKQQTPIRSPYPKVIDGVLFQPLAPCVPDVKGNCTIAALKDFQPNDNSIVLSVQFAGRQVLFAGDIEKLGEQRLLKTNQTYPHLDILKAAHHCSKTSSGDEFLQAFSPKVAICSLGKNNHYGFPHGSVLSRFLSKGMLVYRTDLDGAISVTITPAGILQVDSFLGNKPQARF